MYTISMNLQVVNVPNRTKTKIYQYAKLIRSCRKGGKSCNDVIANLGRLPPLAIKNLRCALEANRQGKKVIISDSIDDDYQYEIPMSLHVIKVPNRKGTKVYRYTRLLRSYRRDGKSTHDIIGNLGRLPPLAIKNLRCALEANRLGRVVEIAE